MIINNIPANSGNGLNVTELMASLFSNVDKAGKKIVKNINGVISQGTELDQGTLLKLQFQVGQYNAMLEMASSVSKSLTDMMKTLAQRTS